MKKENKNITNNLEYSGIVSVDLVDKKGRIWKTNKFHNRGRWPLFSYFCNCVVGENISELKPQYIQLYYGGNVDADVPIINNANPLSDARFSNNLSSNVICNKIAIVNSVEDEASETSVTLKFIIPIVDITIDVTKPITLLVLKCGKYLSGISNSSAFAFVTNNESKLKSLIDYDVISGHLNEYNLSITWTLKFKNTLPTT